MAYTKLFQKNSYWVLLVKDADGKYKLVYKNKLKSLVNKKRAKIQSDSIDAQAELHKKTFVDVYEEFANQLLADSKDEKTRELRLHTATYRVILNFYDLYLAPKNVYYYRYEI